MVSRSRIALPFLECWLIFSAACCLAAPPPPAAAGELSERRALLLAEVTRSGGESAVVLLRAPPQDHFAGDVDYPYRPDNNLFYLTGIDEPGCALLLSGKPIDNRGRELLFIAPKSPFGGTWVSPSLSREEASARSGIPIGSVASITELKKELSGLRLASFGRSGRQAFYFDAGAGFAAGRALTEPYGFLLEALGSSAFHLDLQSPSETIHRLRQVKSPAEVALLEKAIGATERALVAAWRTMRPGAYEYEVRAAIEGVFLREGCSGWSFPPIIGSGPNSCVLHYDRYSRKMQDGDLVVLDIGAEFGCYAADVTRTVPVNGRFTPRQRQVYEAVLHAQEAAIRAVRPGIAHGEVHATALRAITKSLKDLGLITKDEQAHKYFPHGTSHGLGLDVHDPFPISTLAPGMVLTVEPGIYIPEEALGVRIEDDVLVTEDGSRVLSSGAPKTVGEIEELMAARAF